MQLRYAITLHTPYDQAILYGPKRVENRSWKPTSLKDGEWIALHAGMTHDSIAEYTLEKEGLYTFNPELHKPGRIVGLIRIDGWTLPDDDDPWASGPVCWTIGDVLPFSSPIPCRGARRLWRIPHAVIETVRAAGAVEWRNKHPPKTPQPPANPSRCRSCDQCIYWLSTKTGKSAPYEWVPGEGDHIAAQGQTLKVEKGKGDLRSHFATCKDAKNWRRG